MLKNWDGKNIAWVIPADVSAFGVVVEAWDKNNRAAAELLVNELTASGIDATFGEPPESPTLNVRIGVKPLPQSCNPKIVIKSDAPTQRQRGGASDFSLSQ